MKKELKGFIIGLLVSTIGVTSVFATEGIKSAQFNSNKVIFNGKTLDLSSQPMISVIKNGEENFSNYMPIRAVLEQMGYTVNWDSNNNSIIIGNESKTIQTSTESISTESESSIELSKEELRSKVSYPGEGLPDSYKDNVFYFSINSVGGVEVTWHGRNDSGKAIKYYTLNFYMFNRVGDPAICEIKGTNMTSVKYVGPVEPNAQMLAYKNLLGYTESCCEIELRSIVLEYMDGTTETIPYRYATTKKNKI